MTCRSEAEQYIKLYYGQGDATDETNPVYQRMVDNRTAFLEQWRKQEILDIMDGLDDCYCEKFHGYLCHQHSLEFWVNYCIKGELEPYMEPERQPYCGCRE